MRWLFLITLLLSGCGDVSYREARFLEGIHRDLRALSAYERFLTRSPQDPRAAEAHVRAGWIYANKLNRCLEARRHFEAAARLPSAGVWAQRAVAGVMTCPDYFPLSDGRYWVYGDSASGGKAMRLDWEASASTDGVHGMISGGLFAGAKRVRAIRVSYERSDWTIWEIDGGSRRPILRYPYSAGHSWRAGRGKDAVEFTIESDQAEVKTAAGAFQGCLKVKESSPRFRDSWKYDYYAPFVGKVLTTVAGPGFENRNTELLKCEGCVLVEK